ncbi:unnamed protein product [Phytophthora fragariaefolia]|uniref:Unnamed protein product n=1 Tax=Phytophthora fragariaefolia TaxID=1490495 RepID=A0A9W6YPK9_9STRA|nr:unnamed protein product [Phytophthora fragariaefolia]
MLEGHLSTLTLDSPVASLSSSSAPTLAVLVPVILAESADRHSAQRDIPLPPGATAPAPPEDGITVVQDTATTQEARRAEAGSEHQHQGSTGGTALRSTSRPRQPGPQRAGTIPPVAARYQAALGAYNLLAAGSDSDSEPDAADMEKDGAPSPPRLPLGGATNATPIQVDPGPSDIRDGSDDVDMDAGAPEPTGHLSIEAGRASNVRWLPGSGAPDAPFPDVDITAPNHQPAGTQALSFPAMSPRGSGLGPVDFHSPSSETNPSQVPFWRETSPADSAPRESGEIVAETFPSTGAQLDMEGFILENVVPPVRSYGSNYRDWIGSLYGHPISVPANA